MPACPRCGRPVALARPTCLYCGVPLPPQALAALSPPGADAHALAGGLPGIAGTAAARDTRVLLVADVEGANPAAVSRALRLSPFESTQCVRRGGFQLVRIMEGQAAEDAAARLAGQGLAVWAVPEADVRPAQKPRLVHSGSWTRGTLVLRGESGPVEVRAQELLMVVSGPITREYQASPASPRRVRTATLEPGFRLHLHRRVEPTPLELDPGAFDFGRGPANRSSLLELTGWIRKAAAGVPLDERFARLSPALSPAEPTTGLEAALESRSAQGRGALGRMPASLILDNLGQFRFYSGWRAAVERLRTGPTG